jgi:hypothetical protein
LGRLRVFGLRLNDFCDAGRWGLRVMTRRERTEIKIDYEGKNKVNVHRNNCKAGRRFDTIAAVLYDGRAYKTDNGEQNKKKTF